jgi:hypothetical protein
MVIKIMVVLSRRGWDVIRAGGARACTVVGAGLVRRVCADAQQVCAQRPQRDLVAVQGSRGTGGAQRRLCGDLGAAPTQHPVTQQGVDGRARRSHRVTDIR